MITKWESTRLRSRRVCCQQRGIRTAPSVFGQASKTEASVVLLSSSWHMFTSCLVLWCASVSASALALLASCVKRVRECRPAVSNTPFISSVVRAGAFHFLQGLLCSSPGMKMVVSLCNAYRRRTEGWERQARPFGQPVQTISVLGCMILASIREDEHPSHFCI